MSTILNIPLSPRLSMFLAEEQAKADIRQEFGACVGLLHGKPTNADLFEILARMKAAALLVDAMIGIREAHR
jgi:hypothetical protein